MSQSSQTIALRDFPFPFESMVAICSDLDETADFDVYDETLRFAASDESTTYGPGLGLEFGNSMYFDMADGDLSYWNATESARARIRTLIRSGHIDCMHSFGDLAGRPEALRAIEELEAHDCRIRVWVDHAVASTNLGHDIMAGSGDLAGSAAFHTDVSVPFGIRYVWTGRVTSVIGQNAAPSLRGIYNAAAPLASARTLAKELAKRLMARAGSKKYAPHAHNRLLWPTRLASGHDVVEFLRSNPNWGGVSAGETGEGLGDILTPSVLDTLCARRGVSVFYTHLGKGRDPRRPLSHNTVRGLEYLAHQEQSGRILVTTTEKLLDYHDSIRRLRWSASDDRIEIELPPPASVGLIQGLTFYTDSAATEVSLNGEAVPVIANAKDYTGRTSVSVPWVRLQFPA